MSDPILIATWNVHRCVGTDGRRDVGRVADVLAEIGPHVVALQEIDSETKHPEVLDQILHLAERTAFHPVTGPTMRRRDATYGNLLLTSGTVMATRLLDISEPGFEPRGVIDTAIALHGRPLRVITTHLGLRRRERRAQVPRIASLLTDGEEGPLVLAGDFNEWVPFSRTLQPIRDRLGPGPVVRTFPSRWPVLALDKIWVRPAPCLLGVRVHRSRLARLASDHLPVVATVRLDG